MIPRVYFVRHGETEWSRSGQHTSRTEIALTARGEEEACALGRFLAEVRFDLVLVSPRARAIRTAELAGLGGAAGVDHALAEWDYGDDEGLTSAEIIRTRPDWNLFRDGCPHGETPADVSMRADELIRRLRTTDGTVALFSHGHFGRVLAARWIGLPVLDAQSLLLGTSSVSILANDPHHSTVPAIALWNHVL